MNLFSQSLQLLIFCMNDQEFVANLDYALLYFLFLSKSLLIPYAYAPIESIDCILLSSFELKVILLISSVKTLCLPLLNFCCAFDINLLLVMNSLCFFCNKRNYEFLFFLD